MNRTALATGSAALIAAGGLVLAATGPGSASPANRATSHTLTFTSSTLSSTQVGHDRLVETDKALRSGSTIGYTANSCTFDFAAHQAHCLVTLALPRGQIRVRATVNADTGHSTGRVVGGSGAYRGATGTETGRPAAGGDSEITLHWSE